MRQYSGARKIWSRYWRTYGGWHALIRSPYLHAAGVMTILLFPIWTRAGWWEMVLAIMPGMLGLSLAGYAALLAVGDEKFRSLISGVESSDSEPARSPFLSLNATFVHFILTQFLALLAALFVKAYVGLRLPSEIRRFIIELLPVEVAGLVLNIGWGFGFFLFMYALLAALAAVFAVFRVATWYDHFQMKEKSKQKDKQA